LRFSLRQHAALYRLTLDYRLYQQLEFIKTLLIKLGLERSSGDLMLLWGDLSALKLAIKVLVYSDQSSIQGLKR